MTKRKNGLFSIIWGVWALCILFAVPMHVHAEEQWKWTGSCGDSTSYVF
ncbi:MAG: hypothetical protein IJ711_05605 [Lachnospiraceae bacterium]|nr:hypothetical protein [Lachnospiraceae bacterium]